MGKRANRIVELFKHKQVNRQYKDLLFRYVLKDKKSLLMLYNALNKSNYSDESELEITTIENAIYMIYKNDISFLISNRLVLYEHQSSFNPNMPIRGLIYFAQLYENYIKKNDLNIYGSRLVRLPVPQYIIFYNGTNKAPDQMVLKLSDSFGGKHGTFALEVEATMININYGHNMELLEQCKPLMEYAQFIEQVRICQQKIKNLEFAIEEAMEYCIEHNILADILTQNRAGVIKMLLTEFDMKQYMKSEREVWKEEGREEGEQRLLALIQLLIRDNRQEEIVKVISDSTDRKLLYEEYGLMD